MANTKGLLITADKDSVDGILDLDTEIAEATAVMNGSLLTITMRFTNASVGLHNTAALGIKDIFIKALSATDNHVELATSGIGVTFQDLNPGSGAFENTVMQFTVRAKSGKVGGPGI
jgi:hypothetical protein